VKRIIDGKMEETSRRGRRRKQPMDYFKKKRKYLDVKEE
jgi:hypothetical protein